jgi:hypothetical protein
MDRGHAIVALVTFPPQMLAPAVEEQTETRVRLEMALSSPALMERGNSPGERCKSNRTTASLSSGLVDHTWQNKNHILPLQGPSVTIAAVRFRAAPARS